MSKKKGSKPVQPKKNKNKPMKITKEQTRTMERKVSREIDKEQTGLKRSGYGPHGGDKRMQSRKHRKQGDQQVREEMGGK